MGYTIHTVLGFSMLLLGIVFPAQAQVSVNQTMDAVSSEVAEPSQVRYFQEVHEPSFPGAYHALSRLGYNGDYILLVETDAARTPISDTLLVWIQHHGPDQPLARQAEWADLIISCYPDLLVSAIRERHVLPDALGKIWLYFIEERYLIIADQRHPTLDFALKEIH